VCKPEIYDEKSQDYGLWHLHRPDPKSGYHDGALSPYLNGQISF